MSLSDFSIGIGGAFDQPGTPYLGDPAGISAYANQETASANGFILQLGQLTGNLVPPVITPVFPTGGSAPAIAVANPPSFQQVVWTSPNAPDAFVGTITIDDLMPAPFDDDPPLLIFGSAPTAFSDPAPDAPGINLQFDYPDLVVNLPAPPDLLSISIAPFDGINIPDVDFDLPVLTAVAPSIREYVPGALYTSALLTAVQTSLKDRITNGGTGLNPDVENAIWDRGREREYRQKDDNIRALDQMEGMGFAFPPGVYLDARLKIETELSYATAGVSREVMIKQAELEQSNVNNALTLAVQLEGQLMTYTNAVEQRLFDSTRYATEAGISIYNAQVQAYAAYVDAYKGKVQIYEAQIRAEVAKVDAYRAQIAAEEAKAQVNTALVQQYRVQADVALSAVEIYKAQLGAIQTKAEIEKAKIETFGEQVRAYVARINAYTAGVEGYRASIEAEGTKQTAYKSKVDAYTARVEAGARVADARIAEFRGRIEAKGVELQGYQAALSAETSRANAIAASNSTVADAYRSTVTGIASFNDTLTKQWQASLDQAQRVSDIAINAAKANAELYVTTRSLALDAAKVGAQVSAQLGSAAINAINWSTSFSQGYSNSNSFSISNSQAKSYSENYNYNASI